MFGCTKWCRKAGHKYRSPRLVKAGVLDQPDHRYEWRSYWPVGAGQKTNGTGVQIGPEYIGVALIRDADIIGAR